MFRIRSWIIASLTPLLIGCDKPSNHSSDTPAARAASDSTKPSSPLQLIADCRKAAALDYPRVTWAADTALMADLNLDGAPDLVIWGNEGDSIFVVSIVECSGSVPGQVWSLPLLSLADFGASSLEVALENPALGEGFLFESCLGEQKTDECRRLYKLDKQLQTAFERGGRGLSIGVPDSDHIHVYWESDSVRFASWRP